MSGQSGGGQVQGGQGGQQQGGQPPGGPQAGYQQGAASGNEMVDHAKLGAVSYVIVGLGAFLFLGFSTMIGDQQAVIFQGTQGNAWWQAAQTFSFYLPIISVGLAAVLGAYYYYDDGVMDMPAKPAAVAATAGFLALGILTLILAMMLAPSQANFEIGKEFAGLIGALIATVLTAVGVAFAFDNDSLDLL